MRYTSPLRRAFIAAAFAVLLSPAFAADVTARIRGTVTDPAGAVVPNLTVTATNEATGVVYTTSTQGTGDYQFQRLPIGSYTINVSAPGFQNFTATGIKLDIDQQYVEAVKLSLGSSTETVEVKADQVQVDTTNMQLSNIVGSAQIVELPLIGRAFTQLEQLLPGVQASSDRFGGYSANGAQTQQSSFLINGTDTNDLPINTITLQPSVDAIGEFNLITSSLNAEYSRNSGAIVSATIKSGTNQFHGDVFEFYRDTFLNNRNYFQKTPPKYHQNLFGGTLGGPVLKDKLFFFGSYQGNRAKSPQAQNTNIVPTAGQRQGDFSAVTLSKTRTIPAGLTIPGCTTGELYTDCFPGGQVPVADFNPISVALLSKYVPQPNVGANTFTYTGTTSIIQDQGIGRLDFNITPRDNLWVLVMIQHAPSLNTIPFTGATVPGFGDGSSSEIKQYAVDYSRQITPSSVNDLSLHYNRFNFASGTPQQTSLPSSYGFAIQPADLSAAGLPKISVGSGGSNFVLGTSNNGPQPRIDQTYQLDDNFSKTWGRHSLKFGYDGRKFQVYNNFDASNSGSFGFSPNNTLGTGNALLDFFLGIPNSYSQSTQGNITAYAYEHYVYAQDTWKVSDSFTLNFGAGYQVDTALHNRQYKGEGVTCYVDKQQSKIFPNAPLGLNYPGDPGCNDASGSTTAYKDIGPRVGFAYSPNLGWISGEPGKLSIRGGFGIYYNRSEEETSLNNLNDPPYGLSSLGALDFGGSKPGFANPYRDLKTGKSFTNPFPVAVPQPGKPANFPASISGGLSQYDPRFRPPYSENFNLTLEREFPSQIVARVSYVGALGRHNQFSTEANAITPAGHAACLADPACIDDADNQISDYPSHARYGNGDIFPSVGLVQSEGSSNYNSLQLSMTKGMTHGLLLQASYTLSHALDDSSSYENAGYGGSNGRGYNQFNKGLNYGNSAFDARNRFVVSPVYSVPFRKGGNPFLNLVAAGWEISGIQTLAQGFPYDVSYGGGASFALWCSAGFNYYACPDIPNETGKLVRTDPRVRTSTVKSQWFGTSTFVDETPGSFGNISRNKYHGPGLIRTDAQLSKNFNYIPGSESKVIQLRIEGYNVFNHTNFKNPDGNILDTTFGQITGADIGRQIQLSGKLYF
ncbi:MAG: TonB-dependent receptor [Acidobacteriaceae bacterium]